MKLHTRGVSQSYDMYRQSQCRVQPRSRRPDPHAPAGSIRYTCMYIHVCTSQSILCTIPPLPLLTAGLFPLQLRVVPLTAAGRRHVWHTAAVRLLARRIRVGGNDAAAVRRLNRVREGRSDRRVAVRRLGRRTGGEIVSWQHALLGRGCLARAAGAASASKRAVLHFSRRCGRLLGCRRGMLHGGRRGCLGVCRGAAGVLRKVAGAHVGGWWRGEDGGWSVEEQKARTAAGGV